MNRWTETQNRLLIQLVKERPLLWCKTDPENHNREFKEAVWHEIDDKLGTSGASRRFKSLRDDFTRYNKGTRKDYLYAGDLQFLQTDGGLRTSRRAKNSLTKLEAETTIELLDESDQDHSEGEAPPDHLIQEPLDLEAFMGDVIEEEQVEAPMHEIKRARLDQWTPMTVFNDTTTNSSSATTDWQMPVDNTQISREDFQYCKTIISAMSSLPRARIRKLKSNIYNMIVETVNEYEDEVALERTSNS